ncbi:ROK family transcriptional regulator [Fusobacterium mortiferum]|uniref:ROK family transcriptional regulator n=1 Tax=Fusobacterium mortiferum TaxID=850 RepID=A0ABS2FZC0_FUSMR|nr:ROK family transcriptional regulator [Fusobacterium mortiferum]MBM6874125.1 ROK family transcriptional regulator [Fusobacterium mortiferum]
MKIENLKLKILELIKAKNGISRIDISREFGITPAAVGKVINEFLEKKIIIEEREGESSGGRKPSLLNINKDKIGNILGVYFAPTFVQVTIGDIDGNIISTRRYRLGDLGGDIVGSTEEIIEKELTKNKDIEVISVVMNGLVDSERGVSIFSPHYNTKNISIVERFQKKFRKKVYLENDVRVMALVEKVFGECRDNQNFVVLNVEEGVGGSIYLNDMLYHGYGSMSGELGHMVVKRNSLEKCSCGKKGCLETEVSNRAIIKKIMAQIRINNQYSSLKKVLDEGKKLEIKDVLEGVEEKDMLSLSVVGEAIQYIAYALDMIISVINPEKIILYGEFFQNKYIFKSLLNEIGKITLDEQNYQIKRSKFYEKIYEIAPLALGNYLIFKK